MYRQEHIDFHVQNGAIVLVLGDCIDVMSVLESESFDLVLTDPAYETMMRWRGVGTTARMGMGKVGSGSDDIEQKWFPVFTNDRFPTLIKEVYRVLKRNRHAYIMCDFNTLMLIHRIAIQDGVFPPQKVSGVVVEPFKPLIWDKVIPGVGYTYRPVYEFIAMLWKGKKRRLNDLSVADILRFRKPWGKERVFPTQKPVELFRVLVGQSTQEQEWILDPFVGSGTTAIAASMLNRNFVGIDISIHALDIAMRRLDSVGLEYTFLRDISELDNTLRMIMMDE